jgi:hypothetical protein
LPLNPLNQQQLSDVILRCLREGKHVEIDGFGTFFPEPGDSYRFQSFDAPRIFIAYALENAAQADRLFDSMQQAGMNPWMDRRKLHPGQHWARAIESVIEASDFFLPCLSSQSVSKRGVFQSELRYALDIARRVPLEDPFLVPVRLDDCAVPVRIKREWQYIDLFPNWDEGVEKLLQSLRRQWKGPSQARLQPIL